MDSFRKLIGDGLLRGTSGYDAIFVPRWATVGEEGKPIHLTEICGFADLDVKAVSEGYGCPPLWATGGESWDALL